MDQNIGNENNIVIWDEDGADFTAYVFDKSGNFIYKSEVNDESLALMDEDGALLGPECVPDDVLEVLGEEIQAAKSTHRVPFFRDLFYAAKAAMHDCNLYEAYYKS